MSYYTQPLADNRVTATGKINTFFLNTDNNVPNMLQFIGHFISYAAMHKILSVATEYGRRPRMSLGNDPCFDPDLYLVRLKSYTGREYYLAVVEREFCLWR